MTTIKTTAHGAEQAMIAAAIELTSSKDVRHHILARFVRDVMVPYVRYLENEKARISSPDDTINYLDAISGGLASLIATTAASIAGPNKQAALLAGNLLEAINERTSELINEDKDFAQ